MLKAQNPQKTNRKKLIPLKVLPKKVLWYDLDGARIVDHHRMENSYVINDARESCIFWVHGNVHHRAEAWQEWLDMLAFQLLDIRPGPFQCRVSLS